MTFKDEVVHDEFQKSPIFLQIIAKDFADYSIQKFNIEACMTRVLENIPGDSQVHEQKRAVDFRNEHGGVNLYDLDQEKELLKYINEKYYRNDGKLTMICHSFNNGPKHFHIQIAVFSMAYTQ